MTADAGPRPVSLQVDLGRDYDVDLGEGRVLWFSYWLGQRAGFLLRHPMGGLDGISCYVSGLLDTPFSRWHFYDRPKWEAVSDDPLTLAPWINCPACGEHAHHEVHSTWLNSYRDRLCARCGTRYTPNPDYS